MALFILVWMALSTAMSSKPRPMPGWLLTITTRQPAWLSRATASSAPGSGTQSSGEVMKSSLGTFRVPSRSRISSFMFMG